MFAVMNKKWWKRGLILGVFAIVAYVFLGFFFLDFLAERRFLKEEKIATKTYLENRTSFDKIRLISDELPNYDLSLNEKGENYLTLHLKEINLHEQVDNSFYYNFNPEFSQGPIDVFINEEKWLIKIEHAQNDSAFQESIIFFKKNFTKFEKIRDGIKKINSTQISNKKNFSLNIRIKEDIYEGLQYSFYYPKNLSSLIHNEHYLGEEIDEYFYFHHYEKQSLFCGYSQPVWGIPSSRFK